MKSVQESRYANKTGIIMIRRAFRSCPNIETLFWHLEKKIKWSLMLRRNAEYKTILVYLRIPFFKCLPPFHSSMFNIPNSLRIQVLWLTCGIQNKREEKIEELDGLAVSALSVQSRKLSNVLNGQP
jgi:hypothetical protein